MVISEAIKYGVEGLSNSKYTDPINESRKILSFLLEKDISFIHIYPNYELGKEMSLRFKNIIDKRKLGIPLEYILNTKNFYGRDFYIDERALIPRWDTEILIEAIKDLSKSKEKIEILEIGAGSGAISITLGLEIEAANVTGIDISEEALEVCNINKEKYKVDNVVFFKSDLFERVKSKYDIIVSNPPYIPKGDLDNLQIEVKKEPKLALDGGLDGLDFYRKIARYSLNFLKNNGLLVFEIGYDQYESVFNILRENNFEDINYKLDLQKYKRVIYGRKEE